MNNIGFYTEKELKIVGFNYIGKNTLISKLACFYNPEKISIGNNTRIDDFCILKAKDNIDIGNYVHISNFCMLSGIYGIKIEDFCALSIRCSLFSASDDYSGNFLTNSTVPDQYKNTKKGKIVLRKHAIIGAHSVILPAVTINKAAAVGAISLVTKDIEEFTICGGIPAKFLKKRDKNLLKLENKILNS